MADFVFGSFLITAPNIHAARMGYEEIFRLGLNDQERGSLDLNGGLWQISWVQIKGSQAAAASWEPAPPE